MLDKSYKYYPISKNAMMQFFDFRFLYLFINIFSNHFYNFAKCDALFCLSLHGLHRFILLAKIQGFI